MIVWSFLYTCDTQLGICTFVPCAHAYLSDNFQYESTCTYFDCRVSSYNQLKTRSYQQGANYLHSLVLWCLATQLQRGQLMQSCAIQTARPPETLRTKFKRFRTETLLEICWPFSTTWGLILYGGKATHWREMLSWMSGCSSACFIDLQHASVSNMWFHCFSWHGGKSTWLGMVGHSHFIRWVPLFCTKVFHRPPYALASRPNQSQAMKLILEDACTLTYPPLVVLLRE